VVDPKTGKKKTAQQTLREYMLEEQDNFRVVGTAMYAALAAHLPNKKYLKKDDVESLLYLLSYFGMGQLPWRYKTNQEGLERMMNYKYEIKPKELFPPNVFPPQFPKLYEYIRYIPDDQEADFSFIMRELQNAANHSKIDPSLMMPLDWMNFKPLNSNTSSITSPAYPKASRQHINSQMSKNTVTNSQANNLGLKTPVLAEKSKKQTLALTPDIHTKTSVQRAGLVGAQANSSICNTQPSQSKNINIMGKNVNMGQGVNSVLSGLGSVNNGTANNNSQVYTGGNDLETEL
jgi:hypothetical protein